MKELTGHKSRYDQKVTSAFTGPHSSPQLRRWTWDDTFVVLFVAFLIALAWGVF